MDDNEYKGNVLRETPRLDEPLLSEKPRDNLPFRLVILLCICFLTFGSYWVFDTPGAIPTKLKDYFAQEGKSLSDSDLLMFYSIYSWPNTVLALFGGIIVDKITGLRVGVILFCFFITCGQALFAIGIINRLYWVAFAGRFLFGLGGESLTVVQNSFTVKWFSGKYISFAFGIVLAFARVGSSVNFVATPALADTGVPFAVIFGVGACVLSFLFCLILSALDIYAEKKMPYLMAPKEEKEEGPQPNILIQVAKIPFPAWVLNFICLFFYVGVLTFNTVASQIMQKTGKKYDESTATLFLSIPMFVSVFASPLFGFIVDRTGRALNWIALASCMMIVSMLCFLGNANEWFAIPPPVLMVWQGIGYAMGAASIWPSLSHVLPKDLLGSGYGAMTSIQNIGMAIFPLIIGSVQDADSIKDTTWKYTIPIFIFIACEATSLLLSLLLIGLDKKLTGGRLNSSGAERAEAKAKQESKSVDETESDYK